jgi:transcriptional regulator with XRE-family HTH domain
VAITRAAGGERAMSSRNSGVCLRGEALREARQGLLLTQEALATAAQVTTRTVQRAEAGDSLAMESVQRLAAALEMPLVALLRPGPSWVRDRLMTYGLLCPAAPTPWAERDTETRALREALTAGHPACFVVTGLSGIGKTSLASHVAHLLRSDFPDGIAWLGPAGWKGHRGQLAVADALRFRDRLPPAELAGSAALDTAFGHRFFELSRLLVLDDVTDAEQVQRFWHPRARLLVTSALRCVADELGWGRLELGPLTLEHTMGLLDAHLGERAERDESGLRSLAAVVAGSPRSAQIAGKVLRRERHVGAAEYAAQLREALERGADGARPPDDTFFAAHTQLRRRVSDAAWGVFGAVGFFEGVRFTAQWAAAAADVPVGAARRHLGELVDAYLLSAESAGAGAGPIYRLDASASRAARWSGHGTEPRVWERLLVAARPPEAVATLRSEAELWQHLLGHALASCWPDGAPGFVPDPAELPPWSGPVTATARVMPRLLGLLGGPLTFAASAATRGWFCDASAVARALGDVSTEGRLAAHVARVSLGVLDLPAAQRWGAHAARLLADSDADASAVARLWQATATFVLVGAPGLVTELEPLLAVARHPGVSGRVRAMVMMAAASGLAASADGDHLRQSEALYAAVAADPPSAATAPLIEQVATINVAVVRRALGWPVPDATEAALDALRAGTPHDGLDLWRHDAIRAFLGLQPSRTAPPTDVEAQELLLLSPEQETLHRAQSLMDLVVLMPAYFGAVAGGHDATTLLGMGAPWAGRATEIEVGNVMLLFPLAGMAPLISRETLRLAGRWARAALPEEHPLLDGLGRLAEAAGLPG